MKEQVGIFKDLRLYRVGFSNAARIIQEGELYHCPSESKILRATDNTCVEYEITARLGARFIVYREDQENIDRLLIHVRRHLANVIYRDVRIAVHEAMLHLQEKDLDGAKRILHALDKGLNSFNTPD